jgi:hypothetical protein
MPSARFEAEGTEPPFLYSMRLDGFPVGRNAGIEVITGDCLPGPGIDPGSGVGSGRIKRFGSIGGNGLTGCGNGVERPGIGGNGSGVGSGRIGRFGSGLDGIGSGRFGGSGNGVGRFGITGGNGLGGVLGFGVMIISLTHFSASLTALGNTIATARSCHAATGFLDNLLFRSS